MKVESEGKKEPSLNGSRGESYEVWNRKESEIMQRKNIRKNEQKCIDR